MDVWSKSSINCNISTLIQQGLELLDAMNEVFIQKQWRMEHFDEECKTWLLFLLEFVKYDHNPKTFLHEFISSDDYVVTKSHQGFIVDEVCLACSAIFVCMSTKKCL